MSDTTAGLLQVGLLVVALGVCYHPLGAYLAHVYSSERDWRVERGIYRLIGVDSAADQRWPVYVRSVLAFSLVCVLGLHALQRLQPLLPLSLGFPGVAPDQAFNTAASFVSNTNWQSYYGESTMGHLTQMAGLAVQNFVSAAVGMAVAVALIRGFARSRTDRVGNFWVDLVRGSLRILLPIAVVGTIALVAMGAVQNFSDGTEVTTVTGQAQTITGGPVASQEVIKELGTNGGGFYNANSAHPFENPTPLSNLFEIFLILVVPVCLTRTFGLMVADRRQGYAILAAMRMIWALVLVGVSALEATHPGTALQLAGSSMEGKETRFGEAASALFATSTTGTSTGAVNSFHSSYSALGGGLLILNMGLGEVAPGGVGSGLYGNAGARHRHGVRGGADGRTHTGVLGQKITSREIKLVALYILTMPVSCWPGPRWRWRCRGRRSRFSTLARTGCRRACDGHSRGPDNASPRRPARPEDPGHLAAERAAQAGSRVMVRTPVMLVVEVGAVASTVLAATDSSAFAWATVVWWLGLTVAFANLAEAVAEGRGKAQAASLRRAKTETIARRLRSDGTEEQVPAPQLRPGDRVVVKAGQLIPGDGDVIEGVASVDESAITGESAPVIRESGGDRSSVTGGTKVLSDRIVVLITAKPGESFIDRMIALVEGASRQKTPNEIALNILLAGLTVVFLMATVTLQPFAIYAGAEQSLIVLVALLVCLIPPRSARCCRPSASPGWSGWCSATCSRCPGAQWRPRVM